MNGALVRRRLESVPFVTPLGEDPHFYVPPEDVGRIPPNQYCRAWMRQEQRYCHHEAGHGTAHPGFGRCTFHGGRHEGTRRYANLQHPRIADLIEFFENDPDPLNAFSELAFLRALAQFYVEEYDEITQALLGWHASFRVTKRPIPAGLQASFEGIVNEYEALLVEGELLDEAKTIQVEEARKFVHILQHGPDVERPRKVADITEVSSLVDSIGRMMERIAAMREKNAVSEAELNRILNMMGRVVDVVIPNGDIPAGTVGSELKAKIREGWLDVVTR